MSETHDEHSSPIKTPKQLAIVVVLAFVIPIAFAVALSQLVTSGEHGLEDDEQGVLSRIQPVGTVVIADAAPGAVPAPAAPAGASPAAAAPAAAAAAAPAAAAPAAAAPVAAAPVAAAPATAGAAGAPSAAPTTVAAAAHPAGKADGKQVYDSGCVVCHGAGIAGAPKFGDKAQWAPRLATGIDALYVASIKGKGVMPAKGGNPTLSDDAVKAAVDYMVAAAK